MESILPSGPKPTKEAYLSNLRTLKEHHKSGDDDMITQKNSPLKSMKGKTVLCIEELIAEKEAAESKLILENKVITEGIVQSKKVAVPIKSNVINAPSKPLSRIPVAKAASLAQTSANAASKHVMPKNIPKKSENIAVAAVQENPIKLGRKATRRFTKLSEILPNYKLDKSMKREVVAELQKINCWSDDEEEDISGKNALVGADNDESSDSECEREKKGAPAITTADAAAVNGSMRQAVLGNTSLVEKSPVFRTKKTHKSSSKHSYLEQQKEHARLKARTAIVKKAVKVYVRMRKEEMDLYHKNHFALHGKASLERVLLVRLVEFRVNKIMNAAFSSAVDRRLKMDRKEQRRQRRRDAAQRVIHRAWRKFRVRFLLGYVIAYIRLKARLFREEQIREEKNFRMRTAMRRVCEDKCHKEWLEQQRACPTFPVKEHMAAAQEAQLAKEVQWMEQELKLQQMHITAKPGSATRAGRFKHTAATKTDTSSGMLLSPRPPSKPSGSTSIREDTINSVFLTQGFESKSKCSPRTNTHTNDNNPHNTSKSKELSTSDFAFHRPDLAPFSTMINSLVTNSTIFRSKATPQSWSDVATVGADFGAAYRQQQQHLKSPAYRALEKLCGMGEADVTRSKLRTRKEGAEWKLKSFGHSLVSL